MKVKRSNIQLKANDKRVIINFLDLAVNTNNTSRVNRLLDTVLSIPENELETLYERIKKSFASRHRNFEHYLKINFKKIQTIIPTNVVISQLRSLVIGAYFSKEYSVQSAELFNPNDLANFLASLKLKNLRLVGPTIPVLNQTPQLIQPLPL